MNVLLYRLRDNFLAVLPITFIVLLLNFTLVPLGSGPLRAFIIGSLLIILGLALFLIGVDIGITPLGDLTGEALAKTNKLSLVLVAGLILGFFISVAEPGLLVLATQVEHVTNGQMGSVGIMLTVSIGLAVLIALGLFRILYNIPLYILLTILYGIIFLISRFVPPEFLAIAFDASGATTGILAVPFILALSIGISSLKRDSKSSEKDSFGLIAIASTGAIISVMVLNILSNSADLSGDLMEAMEAAAPATFVSLLPAILGESFLALLPLLLIFLVLQRISFRLSRRAFARILKGFVYAFIGLFLFLLGVNGGFMDVGAALGSRLANLDSSIHVILVGFFLGVVTILAEPAVYVLTHQIEEVTAGYVRRKSVLVALSLGVGLAVTLSVIRVLVPPIQLWHYLLPGYIICIGLMYIVPKLFVGIAFDAGGVATGPMTATFILAYTNGAAEAFDGANVLVDGFGMIAMVAMTPIITLQILGLIFKVKSRKVGVPQDAN